MGFSAIGRDYFRADVTRCALIVIDMQNEFVEEDAAYGTTAKKILPNLEKLIKFCREAKVPIIWTQSDHSPPYGGLFLKKFPPIGRGEALWTGTRSFELYPKMMQPEEGEFRIVKHKFDAFYDTALDLILKNLHKDMLIITGTATNACCESTARTAFHKEYYVAFVSDATATFSAEFHEASLRNIDLLFGRVVTTAELIEELQQTAQIARTTT